MEGKFLGGKRYKILDKIGRGGMATIYLGEQVILERKVAIKLMRPSFIENENLVQSFIHEAQMAAHLSHTNIIHIYDFGYEEGQLYMVMEYVDGPDLKNLLAQEAPLSPQRAIKIAIQICEALDYSHNFSDNLVKGGVTHRDIKPGNILLTDDDLVKISDFGIAQVSSSLLSPEETPSGHTGTPVYMSPEQARGEIVDHRTDIYSTGLILSEMLTGEPPFLSHDIRAVLHKHVYELPPSPRKRNPFVPEELERIIFKALSKRREDRYQSAEQMAEDLRAIDLSSFGSLEITSVPSPARIIINGVRCSRETPALFEGVPEGSYELEIRKGDYDIFRKEIEVKPGEPRRVKALLTAEEGLGSIKVSSDPGGAKIYIDESYQGSTPPRQDILSCRVSWLVENLEPGKHILRVAKDGYRDYEEEVEIRSGQVESINCELIPLISRDISMSKDDTLPSLERQKELEAFLEEKILDIVEEEDLDEIIDVKKNKRRSSIRFAILVSLSFLILFLSLLGIYYYRGSQVKEEVEMIAICSLPLEARVFMDEEYLGKTPLTLKPPPLGEHQLRLFLPGYESWKGELKTEGDSEIYVVLKEDEDSPEVLGVGSTIPTPGQPLVLKAIIKDNSFVEKASLFYRRLGEKDWRGSQDFELISSEDNEYQAIVPSSELGNGIQYYLEVSDGANSTRFPREDLIAVKLEAPLMIASTDRIGGEEQVALSQPKIVSPPVESKPPLKISVIPIASAQEAKEVPPPPLESPEVGDEGRFSSLKIDSKPVGSKIYLNDEFLGYAPLLRYHLSSGRYRVKIAKDGFHNWQAMIKIREGEDMNLDVELKAY